MQLPLKLAHDSISLNRSYLDSYAELADEYYDPVSHPTCANFAEASRRLLADWLQHKSLLGRVCEVGAGRSILADLLTIDQGSVELILTDRSVEMLLHSRQAHPQAKLIVCDACDLPVRRESLDSVVSMLGDPYNSPRFWSEAARVLRPKGSVFFATPSWEWATSFRSHAVGEKSDAAMFVTRSGARVYTRSMIRPEVEHRVMIQNAGLKLLRVTATSVNDLQSFGRQISHKLADHIKGNEPVVTGYWACKP